MGIYFVKDWYCKPYKKEYQGIWVPKTWNGLTEFRGCNIWTDGNNIYRSAESSSSNYVLDRSTSTWSTKTLGGVSDKNYIKGYDIWTDGANIYANGNYYDRTWSRYVYYSLVKNQDSLSNKTLNGFTDILGNNILTDGNNIYYSYETSQYVLDKTTSTWSTKTWGGLVNFYGKDILTDGNNIYYSSSSTQYVLDKSTGGWKIKTWSGLTNFDGSNIWTDGNNVYYSYESSQYILDKTTSTWSTKTWNVTLNRFRGFECILKDGDHIYFSDNSSTPIHYELT